MSSEVSFKVVLQHNQRNQTKHRFRGDFSYEQVCALLSYLWGGKKNLVIEYTDEEGDDILVLTDVEWRECVRLHAERQEREGKTLPLTLRVKKARVAPKNSKRAAAKAASATDAASTHVDPETAEKQAEGDSSSDSEGLEYVSANGSLVGRGDSSMLRDSRCSDRSAAPSSVPSTAQKARVPAVEAHPALVPPLHLSAIRRTKNNGAAGSMVEATTMADAASLTLLNKLLGVDIVELLASGHPLPFHPAFILQRTTDDESGDVHLDLDLPELRKSVITGGNMMMDSRQFTAARVLLEAAVAVFPNDSVIEYNLACASSLEGSADGALYWLEQALSHGYQDTTLLLIDEDLQVARASSKFMPLIERYFPGIAEAQQPQQQAPPANSTASDSAKAANETPAAVPEIPAAPQAAPAAVPEIPAAPQAVAPVVSPAVPVVTVLPPPETPRTNTLLGIFPTMNPAEAHRLLELAKGNLNLAVQWKLGSV